MGIRKKNLGIKWLNVTDGFSEVLINLVIAGAGLSVSADFLSIVEVNCQLLKLITYLNTYVLMFARVIPDKYDTGRFIQNYEREREINYLLPPNQVQLSRSYLPSSSSLHYLGT